MKVIDFPHMIFWSVCLNFDMNIKKCSRKKYYKKIRKLSLIFLFWGYNYDFKPYQAIPS